MDLRRNILWVDGLAGASVGATVTLFHRWLSGLYGLPENFVLLMGVVNLLYGSYSLSLARRSQRRLALIKLLVVGNLFWAVLCVRWTVLFSETASILGFAQLLGEALFVTALACLEWRWRDSLCVRSA